MWWWFFRFDNYSAPMVVDGIQVSLGLWDTGNFNQFHRNHVQYIKYALCFVHFQLAKKITTDWDRYHILKQMYFWFALAWQGKCSTQN